MNFSVYMILTTILFAVFYSRLEIIQRSKDPNRITTLKTVMELEDADFVEMVNELKLDYDSRDLAEIEREVSRKTS